MASLEQAKIHDQSGSFRMMVPKEWRKANQIKSKDSLDIIVTHALVVLPPRELNNEEVEEIIRDFRQMIRARTILQANKTPANTHDMKRDWQKP